MDDETTVRSAGLKFGSLVHARLTTLGVRPDDFARQHEIDPDELDLLLECEPVTAETAIAVMTALGWSSGEILDDLDRLPRIPIRGNATVVSTRDAHAPRESSEPGVLLRAYVQPNTLSMVRVEVDRPERLPNMTPEFIERRLLGRGWIKLYSAEYVATMDTAIQAAHRGEVAPVIYGSSGTGENARVVVMASDDGLVELRYQLDGDVEPITRKRWHFSSLNHGRALYRRDLTPNRRVDSE